MFIGATYFLLQTILNYLIFLEAIDYLIPVFSDGQVCLAPAKLFELVELLLLQKVQVEGENVSELGHNPLGEVVIVSSLVVLEWNSVQEVLGITVNRMKMSIALKG